MTCGREVGENGQILEAVVLGGPLKLLALSLSLIIVGGGNSLRGLKTPSNCKIPHKRQKISELYLAYSRSQFGITRCKIQYFM